MAAAVAGEEPGEARSGDQGTISVMKEAGGPRRAEVTEWKLTGRVYDLVTLKPLGACTVELLDNAVNARAQTVTDTTGRFRILLAPLQDRGYLVSISRPGYAKSYFSPTPENPLPTSPMAREDLARGLPSTVAAPAVLMPPTGERTGSADFFLAPLR